MRRRNELRRLRAVRNMSRAASVNGRASHARPPPSARPLDLRSTRLMEWLAARRPVKAEAIWWETRLIPTRWPAAPPRGVEAAHRPRERPRFWGCSLPSARPCEERPGPRPYRGFGAPRHWGSCGAFLQAPRDRGERHELVRLALLPRVIRGRGAGGRRPAGGSPLGRAAAPARAGGRDGGGSNSDQRARGGAGRVSGPVADVPAAHVASRNAVDLGMRAQGRTPRPVGWYRLSQTPDSRLWPE